MQKQSFFALTAWRLGGASVRRAAMTLAVMVMTATTAWATEVSEIEIPSNTGNIWEALQNSSAATVTTSNGVTTITLNACIKTSETLEIGLGGAEGAYILDLNGYGIRYTGDKGSVIKPTYRCSSLTLKDSRPTATTYYISLTDGRGTSVADSGTESETCLAVTGGYITGGNASNGGGVYYKKPFTMTGGTICGNKATGAGGVDAWQFTMSGGAIRNNISLDNPHSNNAYISGPDGYCRIHKDLTLSEGFFHPSYFDIKRFGYSVTVNSVNNTTVTASEGEVEIDGTKYYLEGQTVTLSDLPTKAGWLDWQYTVTKTADGTDITASALSGTTLTVPNYDVTVTLAATPDPTHFSVSGNEYTIHTATGWDVFCDLLAADDGKTFFSGKTVKLGADITVSRMAGADYHDFTGTFDGQGNKLTFTATATDNYLAPFRNVQGNSTDDHAVIRNLKVETNITANDYRHTAGLIAQVWGYVDVTDCNVTVNINSTKGTNNPNDLYPAGLVSQVVSGAQLTVSGCTVGGTISTDGKYAGGIVGIVQGSASITDCVSSVTIDSSTSGDGTHGGIVAVQGNYDGSTITIEGCVFNGCLLGSSTTCCGGFVGWRSKTVTISNSLFDPAEVGINTTEGNTPCSTFVRNGNSTPTNSYYTTAFSTVQGKQARSITAGGNVTTNGNLLESEAVTIDHAGVPTAYTTSGITAYKATENSSTFIAGLLYNKVLYAGNGDEVSLTLSNTPPDGYGFHSYTTDNATISGDANPYTLTMPNADVWIKAMFDPLPITVRYIDEKGQTKTVTNALDLSKFDGVIPNGSVCSFSSKDLANVNFRIGGDVTVILPDDFELRIENIDGDHTITFYGQEKGNGKLYVTKSIYNNVTVYAGSITVGVDEESEGNVIGNSVNSVTVHGGSLTNRGNVIGNSVTVSGGSFTNGGDVNGAVTVSGGSFTNGGYVNSAVTVSGGSFTNGGDVNGNVTVSGGNVHIDGTINNVEKLSWTKPSDSFYAATIKGSVEIPEDKIFYDEDGKSYSGIIALDYETGTNPIDGKTLRPFMNITLANNDDNSSAISNWNGGMADVTLNDRTLYKDGKWNTLCLPFNVTVGSGQMEGATAMTFDGETSGFVASTGVLTLNFVGVDGGRTITAGTPFIVKWTGTDVTNPVFSGVTVSSTTAGSVTSDDKKVQFVGTYSPVDIYSPDHCNLYLGSGNTLYYPEGEDMTSFPINACRAYFHVDSEVQSKVRAFVLNFDEDDATGILSTTDDTDFTDSDDAWYDLSGRKLSGKPSQRGVYIHNGRKIAIQ